MFFQEREYPAEVDAHRQPQCALHPVRQALCETNQSSTICSRIYLEHL